MTFSERSAERFAQVSAVIQELFKSHPEEGAEALRIAKSAIASARAEAIAKATSDPDPVINPEFRELFVIPSDGIIRRELSREDQVGNVWIHGPNFEKIVNQQRASLLNKGVGAVSDCSWDAPLVKSTAPRSSERDAPLYKSEIQSGMTRQFSEIRASCSPKEEALIEKAIRALDLPCFFQLLEAVKIRLAAA
jgi:hypothetical protein